METKKSYSWDETVKKLNANRPAGTKPVTLNDCIKLCYQYGYTDENGMPTQAGIDAGFFGWEIRENVN